MISGFMKTVETISKVDDIKVKGKSLFFSLLYLFIFLSLNSFLYFLPVDLAWRRPKGLVKSRLNKGVWGSIEIEA